MAGESHLTNLPWPEQEAALRHPPLPGQERCLPHPHPGTALLIGGESLPLPEPPARAPPVELVAGKAAEGRSTM